MQSWAEYFNSFEAFYSISTFLKLSQTKYVERNLLDSDYEAL